MLAAELGQLAFEAGATYQSLFAFSLLTVSLGAALGLALPAPGEPSYPTHVLPAY